MTPTDFLTRVIKDAAAADGVAVDEVDPLVDYIDPEILNKLGEMEGGGTWRFTFQFGDHQVTLTHDAQVYIDGQLYRSDQSVSDGY